MADVFGTFPNLRNHRIVIRKMEEADVDDLIKITSNPNVYRYIPPFLYRKSRASLLTAIRNIGDRDFKHKKWIVAGIYLIEEPDQLIGLAEMFDYKKRMNQITIGYLINESYWHRGLATEAVQLMQDYLCNEIGIQNLKAFTMPENLFSEKALLKNHFEKEHHTVQGRNWGGNEIAVLNEFTYSKSQQKKR